MSDLDSPVKSISPIQHLQLHMTSSSLNSTTSTQLWLDTHVHFYEIADLNRLLSSAVSNLHALSRENVDASYRYGLFITEGVNENAAERLQSGSCIDWTINEGQEKNVLIAKDQQGNTLNLFLGQQLVSQEGIEVLVMGCDRQAYAPRLPIKDLLKKLCDGITILPWGVGKWLGKRGSLVSDALTEMSKQPSLFIGDIPAQTDLFGGKIQYSLANEQGVAVLRGTDNLPLEGDEARVGQFGSMLTIDAQAFDKEPISYLVAALRCKRQQPLIQGFGGYMPLTKNIYSQFLLRL